MGKDREVIPGESSKMRHRCKILYLWLDDN